MSVKRTASVSSSCWRFSSRLGRPRSSKISAASSSMRDLGLVVVDARLLARLALALPCALRAGRACADHVADLRVALALADVLAACRSRSGSGTRSSERIGTLTILLAVGQ